MTNRFMNVAIVCAILATMAGIQVLDAKDFESEADAERRDWMYAVQHCHRAYGPQTSPEYDDQNMLVCVSRSGDVLPFLELSK